MCSGREPVLIDEHFDVFFQPSYLRLTFYSFMTFKRYSYVHGAQDDNLLYALIT